MAWIHPFPSWLQDNNQMDSTCRRDWIPSRAKWHVWSWFWSIRVPGFPFPFGNPRLILVHGLSFMLKVLGAPYRCVSQGKWSAWSRRPRQTSKRTSKRQVRSSPVPCSTLCDREIQGAPQTLTIPSSKGGSGFNLFSPLCASFLQCSCELIRRCRSEFLTLQLGCFDGKCPSWIIDSIV